MATINDDVDKILIHCGFNISYNWKAISKYGFEFFEDIMQLTKKDIGNI